MMISRFTYRSPNRVRQRASIAPNSGGQFHRGDAHRRKLNRPVRPNAASASKPVAILLAERNEIPPLQTPELKPHSFHRKARTRRKILHRYAALSHEPQQIGPHRKRKPRARKAGSGQRALELVIEFDRVSHQRLR